MEDSQEEFSKFLDETKNHLNLQSLAAYINLPQDLSDKEKQFISDHLAECSRCTTAFNSVFDEDLNFHEKKNLIILFRQPEVSNDELAIIRSEDDLVEIELTRISQSDFNLRFLALPSGLMNQRAALMVDSEYLLRILSMDTDTIYIIHSDKDIINLGSFELVSLTAPLIIPQVRKSGEPVRGSKYYWFTAAIIIIIAATVLIYYATKPEESMLPGDDSTQVITDLTPRQKSVNMTDTVPPAEIATGKQEAELPQNPTDHFSVNTSLENYIDRDNGTNSKVEIISPSAGAQVTMPVRFEWMTARNNMTLRFVILTNQNIPVYERLINGRELTLDTKLNPGLYYWKLGLSDSVLTMSKFYIR